MAYLTSNFVRVEVVESIKHKIYIFSSAVPPIPGWHWYPSQDSLRFWYP